MRVEDRIGCWPVLIRRFAPPRHLDTVQRHRSFLCRQLWFPTTQQKFRLVPPPIAKSSKAFIIPSCLFWHDSGDEEWHLALPRLLTPDGKLHMSKKDDAVVTRDRYRYCPHCANFSHFADKLIYCVICGTKMIEECPECREPIIYPTAKYCPACGKGLIVEKDPVVKAKNRFEG
jgi:hypothetical protein